MDISVINTTADIVNYVEQNFFKLHFDENLENMCIADMKSHQLIKINDTFAKTLEYDKSEIKGKVFLQFVHPDDREDTSNAVIEVINNRTIVKYRNRYVTKTGKTVHFEWTARLLNDRYSIATAKDITDLVETQNYLKKTLNEVKQLTTDKENYFSRMSHELRTPLNSIIGFSQLVLMNDGINDDTKENIEQITMSGKYLLNMINDVLDISTMDSKNFIISIENINIDDIINQSVNLYKTKAEKKYVQIEYNDCHKDILIKADLQRFKQVFINILDNAIKYNKKNGNIFISTEINKDTKELDVIIKDTGLGIKNLDKIYEPFERCGRENTDIEGTGLGLFICKKLIKLMNSNIKIESIFNDGSKVILSMPLANKEDAKREFDGTKPISVLTNCKVQILYIEDNIENYKLIKKICDTVGGIKLQTSVQGSLGLEIAKSIKPDVFLLDLNLPDMSGHDILLQLRASEDFKNSPIYIVSADASHSQIKKLKEAGATDYITKPIDVIHFMQLLKSFTKKI